MTQHNVDRRDFLKTTGTTAMAATTLAALATNGAHAAGPNANSVLRIGFIGPGGRGSGAHVGSLKRLQKAGHKIELVAVCDVYTANREKAAASIKEQTGKEVAKYVDYREMLANEKLDAVTIATPDHWHAKQAIDSMNAGVHVYCEKPMTHTIEEAIDVVRAWEHTGKVMQVGVQSTSLPIWKLVREKLQQGMLGKVLMYQTEFFRNSAVGQWRTYELKKEMTPKTINWPLWLGSKEGLAPDVPFDREIFAQWRRFWPYGSGMYTDLFVHRTTSMLKATGLRYPGRVVGAGGIFYEYDGRDVPDVATVVADFNEGVQGLVTATMCCENTPLQQTIRGHNGSFVFGNGEEFTGFDFVAERSQVTKDSSAKSQRIEMPAEAIPTLEGQRTRSGKRLDTTYIHFENWLNAIRAGDPKLCNNTPDLGAAAIVLVTLGSRSYREGKAFLFDSEKLQVLDGSDAWSKKWERMSKERSKPNHIPGWAAGEKGSKLDDPSYMSLAGPWKNGDPPSAS